MQQSFFYQVYQGFRPHFGESSKIFIFWGHFFPVLKWAMLFVAVGSLAKIDLSLKPYQPCPNPWYTRSFLLKLKQRLVYLFVDTEHAVYINIQLELDTYHQLRKYLRSFSSPDQNFLISITHCKQRRYSTRKIDLKMLSRGWWIWCYHVVRKIEMNTISSFLEVNFK